MLDVTLDAITDQFGGFYAICSVRMYEMYVYLYAFG